MVEVGAAHVEADGRLVRAEGHMAAWERGQVPAPRQGGDLLGMHVRGGDLAAEVDEQACADEVADRRSGHRRPTERQRLPQRLRQPLRRPPCRRRARERGPDPLRVGGLDDHS
ncbi:hypothetical protein ACFYNX_31240 [Streptomyces sp. NPDC007872]|uniref:hypothetical protein n=1 Tax=Streptomyces sp. NPDC007872 TaxID=3364782 RepID=UPI00369473AF